ncbi:hypothetical protein [Mesorhizobium sp. L2C084A000]|uniref:hypothetical protein n=1 Tax=Mesorhizobium sp. L2C084A000 TaxID=1287116 RepID=UPI0003CFBF6F|nr:hypothetical protein [Mesorhizobium sp. L2C084A000]ESZ18451.1 hypothetical protein X734_33075 [Mesorhizobium sp. L2C084A000]
MSLRYSGPAGDYPVYTCRADRDQAGGPLCQEMRALPVDAHVESILLEALTPDKIDIAIARWARLKRRRVSLSASGRCGVNGRVMRGKEHGANMMRWSRRTVWWRVRWSASGKRSFALPR